MQIDAGGLRTARVSCPRDEMPRVHSYQRVAARGDLLQTLLEAKQQKLLGANDCVCVLNEGQYQFMQVSQMDEAAEMSDEDRREALRWHIKDYSEIGVEDACIDYLDPPEQGGRNAQQWVVVAERNVVQSRIHLFQDAAAPLVAIDIVETAHLNLAALFEEEDRGIAMLVFDNNGGRLTISHGGEMYMSRQIETLHAEPDDSNEEMARERVLLDIQRSLDNFDRTHSSIALSRLLVSPMPERDAFVEYLRTNLLLPVVIADLAEVMDLGDVPELVDEELQGQAWSVIGAAMRGM